MIKISWFLIVYVNIFGFNLQGFFYLLNDKKKRVNKNFVVKGFLKSIKKVSLELLLYLLLIMGKNGDRY